MAMSLRGIVSRILFFVALLVSVPTQAMTVTPRSAPIGARVVLSGADLPAGPVTATFTGARSPVTARVIERVPAFVELEVPAGSGSGPITVRGANGAPVSAPFTVEPPAEYVRVITVAGTTGALKKPSGSFVYLPSGAAYFADSGNHQVRFLLPDGRLLVAAGTGKPGFVNGASNVAQFKQPSAVVIDAARKVLYVADSGNHVIRKITLQGMVTTFAGSGRPEDRDGSGASAAFKSPGGLAIDATGNVYVADSGNDKIKVITPEGAVTTIAGAGRPGLANGSAHQAQFKKPLGIAVDARGIVVVADTGNHVLRRSENGVVTTFAGTGHPGLVDGTALVAEFKEPGALTIDEGGVLWIADTKNHAIRSATTIAGTTVVSTLAGGASRGFVDGDLSRARFAEPAGISSAGALYVADTGNDAIRAILPRARLTGVHPRYGTPEGGEMIRLFGAGFIPGRTAVFIGGTASADVRFITSTELLVRTPAGGAGTVGVRITTPAGSAALTDAFTYIAAPVLSSIDPAKGPVAGSQQVTMTGSGFVPLVTALSFDGTPATNVEVVSPNTLTATTPAHASGAIDVRVSTLAGSDTRTDAYTYFAAPVITSFSPAFGMAGTTVVISGSAFDPVRTENTVRFGTLQAAVLAASATQLTASVPAGAVSAPITVTTVGGTATSAVPFVIDIYNRIEIIPAAATLTAGEETQFVATAYRASGASEDVTFSASWMSSDASVVTVSATGHAVAVSPGNASVTARFEGLNATANVTITTPAGDGPPDPTTTATPIDPTVPTSFDGATKFLYEGATPVQSEVVVGAIDEERVAVIRGIVRTRGGQPLAGVRVTAPHQNGTGFTLTRNDGAFDLAINAGGAVTIRFEREGHATAERAVRARLNDFAVIEDVVLVPLDTVATVVSMGVATGQIAQASTVTDADGTRRATLFIPAGTTASIVMPDGSSQAAPSLTIRATEYTVGVNGPLAMPAELPPTSGYTYCVEVSADEARAAGAATVVFSAPIAFYVENFLSIPVGTIVPAGYYDRTRSDWVASDNGRVVRVIAIDGGMASLDITGDNVADDPSTLGVTDDERGHLASLYAAGTSLWRVPLPHLTPWDFNYPFGPPSGALGPLTAPTTPAYWIPAPQRACGSIIDCENQTLGEVLPVQGTPFALHGQSDRAAGYAADKKVTVHLTGATIPADLRRIDLEIAIAGQTFSRSFTPAPDLTYDYTWDGLDAYGRGVLGAYNATIRTGYVYAAAYLEPAESRQSFALLSQAATRLTGSPARQEVTIWRDESVRLGGWRDGGQNLGGWSLTPHHLLDRAGGVLYLGDGTRRTTEFQEPAIDRIAGNFIRDFSGDGGPARSASFWFIEGVAAAPDGPVYVADNFNRRIRRIGRDGIVTTIVGGGSVPCDQIDGKLGTTVRLCNPKHLAAGKDGTLYFVDAPYYLWKIGADGIVHLVAGNGYELGEGVPAADAWIEFTALAMAPDGSLYLGDVATGAPRLRRIAPDGTIATIVSASGSSGFTDSGDGGPASLATVSAVNAVAVGADGSVYLSTKQRVRRIDAAGVITTVAGSDDACSIPADGVPATSIGLCEPGPLAVGLDGSLYLLDNGWYLVRRVDAAGIITTIAGVAGEYGADGDKGPAAAAFVDAPSSMVVGPDGSFYLESFEISGVRRITPGRGLKPGQAQVASSDGSAVHGFDDDGRHLRTLDALTGSTIYTFSYDSERRLASITDADGNVTTIERGIDGVPLAIIAPRGQRTSLAIDTNGQLTSVANAAGTTVLTYERGLLATMTNPRGKSWQFTYDAEGRLAKDADPEGGHTQLQRSGSTRDAVISRSSFMERARSHALRLLTSGAIERTHSSPSGAVTRQIERMDGSIETVTPDGATLRVGPSKGDPRFGSDAKFPTYVRVEMPSGLQMTVTTTEDVTLADENDPLSLLTLAQSLSVNGVTQTGAYDAATRTWTMTSPLGKQARSFLDAKGRTTRVEMTGFAPANVVYDAKGRVQSTSKGARQVQFGYDTLDRPTSITDALGRTTAFQYDAADRVTKQILPDAREILFSYDANGNVTSITPPGRTAHAFTFTSVDTTDTYVAPGGVVTRYLYNKDRQLQQVQRPDGQTVAFVYDAAGRTQALGTARGDLLFAYDAADRVMSAQTPEGDRVEYSYDGSLLTSTTWAGEIAGSIAWSWDNFFRVAQESVGGDSVGFSFDSDGLLTRAGALVLDRNADNGLLLGSTLAGVTDGWSYNAFGEVMSYTASFNGTTLLSLAYTRDDAGRITTIDTAGSTRGYEYDPAGRLTRVTEGGTPIAEYDYDANSNRIAHRYSGGSATAAYDDQDRVITYGDTTFTYAAAGELRTRTLAGATTTFDYDTLGNLRTVALPGGTNIEYVIDGQNRRIGKEVNGTLVRGWLYSGQLRIAAELDATGAVTSRFVYATRSNVPDFMIRDGITYRILADHLGSPRLVVHTGDGTIAQRIDYDEFGNVLSDTNPGFQPFGFAGGLYDADTRLVRFGARDYDPGTGRWTTKDPILFRGSQTNLYGYVQDDPINFVDPRGLEKLNLLPADDPNNTAANWDRDPDDAILINSHGSNVTVNHMKAEALAARIRKAKTWKPGRKVILNSCNAARGENSIAQQLSRVLHTTVVGADQPVWSLGPLDLGSWGTQGAPKEGEIKRGGSPDFTTTGHWHTFIDGVEQVK